MASFLSIPATLDFSTKNKVHLLENESAGICTQWRQFLNMLHRQTGDLGSDQANFSFRLVGSPKCSSCLASGHLKMGSIESIWFGVFLFFFSL